MKPALRASVICVACVVLKEVIVGLQV